MSDYRAYDRYREDSPGSRRDYSPSRRSEYSPPRRSKSTRTYPKERGAPDYVEETTYVERGKGPPPRDLVPRREDSVEDIPRDFPPPSRSVRGFRDDYDDRRSARRSRSEYGGRRDSYEDDYEDYAAGAAGGYAGGRPRRGTRGGRRGGRRDDDYYSEDEEYEKYERRGGGSRSRSGSRGGRRKSGVEGLLEGLGLGGIAGAAAKQFGGGGHERSRSRARSKARSRAGSESRSRSRSRGGRKQRQWAQAAQAAIVAGAVTAFRSRNDPGAWTGEKGRRIATAALGAGGIDRLVDRDPDHKSKRHLAEAVVGGLAATRIANGPRNRSESRSRARSESRGGGIRARSRSIIDRFRSKSRGRSVSATGSQERPARSKSRGIKDLAAGGALAAAGKAIYDRVRSKSRKRDASRSSSEDSYVPSRRRARSRSVGPQSQSARSLGPDDGAVVGPRGRATDRDDNYDDDPNNPLRGTRTGEGGRSSSKSSSSSDTDLENRRKKLRGKELLTAGLASIATIHAGHGVYQSMKASQNRHKLVAEGEMSPEEARKKRSKAWLQDAAAVGIAALGIKGAYSEWREMNEQRHSVKELEERRHARAKRREKRMREMGSGGRRPPQGRLPAPQGRSDDPYASSLPPPPLGATGPR